MLSFVFLVSLSFFLYSFWLRLDCLTAIQFREEPGTILTRRFEEATSLRLTQGLQLDLEIALGGVSAKIQPLRLIQPCRRIR